MKWLLNRNKNLSNASVMVYQVQVNSLQILYFYTATCFNEVFIQDSGSLTKLSKFCHGFVPHMSIHSLVSDTPQLFEIDYRLCILYDDRFTGGVACLGFIGNQSRRYRWYFPPSGY